jgi:tRNA (guanine37-N1)-methyltransferase
LGQAVAQELATLPGFLLVAGRYEGLDERVVELGIDRELSIGDYVLSGGEVPALVVIDTVARLLPGALGDERSNVEESFVAGLLDWPHYTRPISVDGRDVPEVLASGDHAAIRRWRLREALGRTWLRRPELLEQRGLSSEERALLEEFKLERACFGSGAGRVTDC